jgi:hypothetical protein
MNLSVLVGGFQRRQESKVVNAGHVSRRSRVTSTRANANSLWMARASLAIRDCAVLLPRRHILQLLLLGHAVRC